MGPRVGLDLKSSLSKSLPVMVLPDSILVNHTKTRLVFSWRSCFWQLRHCASGQKTCPPEYRGVAMSMGPLPLQAVFVTNGIHIHECSLYPIICCHVIFLMTDVIDQGLPRGKHFVNCGNVTSFRISLQLQQRPDCTGFCRWRCRITWKGFDIGIGSAGKRRIFESSNRYILFKNT